MKAEATKPRQVPGNYRKGARMTLHQRRRHAAILRLLRRTSGRTLDYGCGYGDISYAISQTHPVEGVDVDVERVEFAVAEYGPIRFHVCPPTHLDYPDEAFDVVVSSVVIHFVPNPVQYLREASRVLQRGGHLVIACKNVSHVRNALRAIVGRGPAPSKLWIRDKRSIVDLLERENFKVEAESYICDPPFVSCKNFADVVIRFAEGFLSALRIRSTCGYFVLLARKVS